MWLVSYSLCDELSTLHFVRIFWLKFYFVALEGVTPDAGVEEDLAGRDSAEGNNSKESSDVHIMIVHVCITHFFINYNNVWML